MRHNFLLRYLTLSMVSNSNDILSSNHTSLNNSVSLRYPLRDCREPDRFSFSKSSSNIAYLISDFISYHHLSKSCLAFVLQLSSISIYSHFQKAFGDPK